MIVFDLQCGASHHVFEAWFASSEAYEDQSARGLICCPFCGDSAVGKALMAPRVGMKGNQAGDAAPLPVAVAAGEGAAPAFAKALIAKVAEIQAQLLEKSDWVGGDFADQARAMHLGETEQRSIHGQASASEAEALIEEGVAVMPLPLPVLPPESRN